MKKMTDRAGGAPGHYQRFGFKNLPELFVEGVSAEKRTRISVREKQGNKIIVT